MLNLNNITSYLYQFGINFLNSHITILDFLFSFANRIGGIGPIVWPPSDGDINNILKGLEALPWLTIFILYIIIIMGVENNIIDVQLAKIGYTIQNNNGRRIDLYALWDLNDPTSNKLRMLFNDRCYNLVNAGVWNPRTNMDENKMCITLTNHPALDIREQFVYTHTPHVRIEEGFSPLTTVELKVPAPDFSIYTMLLVRNFSINNNGIPLWLSFNPIDDTLTIKGILMQVT